MSSEKSPTNTPSPKVRGAELTPLQRAKIQGAADFGISAITIAKTYNINIRTVRYTIQKASLRTDHASLSRPGRPRKWTEADLQAILRFASENPKATYRQIREGVPTSLSDRTLGKILKENKEKVKEGGGV